MIGYWKRSSNLIGLQRFLHTMRAIQGALIVASSIQIVLGYSQIWGLFSRYSSCMKCVRNFENSKKVFKHLLYVFLQIFQSSWHGTCSWIGWIRVHSTRISCGRCGSIYFIFHGSKHLQNDVTMWLFKYLS